MIFKKIVRWILKKIIIWGEEVIKSFIKNLPQSLISLGLLPIFVYSMVEAISGFSIFAVVGYLFYSIVNLGKILEDIRRSVIWGVAYIFGAVAFEIFLTSVIPLISKGDGTSIFSGLVICYVALSLLLKKEELKK
jgi:hypothetical protein